MIQADLRVHCYQNQSQAFLGEVRMSSEDAESALPNPLEPLSSALSSNLGLFLRPLDIGYDDSGVLKKIYFQNALRLVPRLDASRFE